MPKQQVSQTTTFNSKLMLPQNGDVNKPYIIYARRNSIEIYDIKRYQKMRTNFSIDNIEGEPLVQFIRTNELFSVTVVCSPVAYIHKSVRLDKTASREIEVLLATHPDALITYVVTHKTGGGNPLLVHVGGDCYRPERGALLSIMERTRDLATGMLRKASMIFPDIPALTGGKKGEFVIVNPNTEESVSGFLSDKTIFQLSCLVLPVGISFLNFIKGFNEQSQPNTLPPDSISPDVYTGQRWDKYCPEWIVKQGVSPKIITCLPAEFGGSGLSSSVPTAAGVTTTANELIKQLLNNNISAKKFLLEGGGGVGKNAMKFLVEDFGVAPANITMVDISAAACEEAKKIGVNAVQMEANKFYHSLTGEAEFDLWMNNGVGDTAGLLEVQKLLQTGIKIFMGGANNLFRVDELDGVLNEITMSDAYAYPDWATSAGGWTYAVLDQFKKCGGNFHQDALHVIKQRNTKMVNDAFTKFTAGADLWRKVEANAKTVIDHCLVRHSTLTNNDFNINNWAL